MVINCRNERTKKELTVFFHFYVLKSKFRRFQSSSIDKPDCFRRFIVLIFKCAVEDERRVLVNGFTFFELWKKRQRVVGMSHHVVVASDFRTMLRGTNAESSSSRSPDDLLSHPRTFWRVVELIARRSAVLRLRQLPLARRPACLALVSFRRQSLKRKLRLADLLQALAPMSDVLELALKVNRVFGTFGGAYFDQVFVERNGSIFVDSSVFRIIDRFATRNRVVEVLKREPGHFPKLLINPAQLGSVACRCAIGKTFGVLICKTIKLMPNRGARIINFVRVNDIKVVRSVVIDWNYRQRVKSVSGIVASVGILRFRFGLK